MTHIGFFSNYNSGRTRIFAGAIIIIMMINFNPLYSNDIAPFDDYSSMDQDLNVIVTSSRAGVLSRGSENVGPDSWLTFMGNITHHGNSTSISPIDNGILWERGTEGGVFSSPTINNGRVYFGANDWYVYCLDIDTGEVIWKHHTSEYSPVTGGGGVKTSLSINDGNIVFGCDDWYVYSITESDGGLNWYYKTDGEVTATPTIADGKVFGGSNKGYPAGNGSIFALDEQTGAELWLINVTESVASSPAYDNGMIYIGSDDSKLYALYANNGTEAWNFTAGNAIKSSPAVSSGMIYFGSLDRKLYAIDASTGGKNWDRLLDGAIESSPAVASGIVYITTKDGNGNNQTPDGGLYAIDGASGSQKWKELLASRSDSSPALAEDRVFVYHGEYLEAFTIDTHDSVWEKQIPAGSIHSSPAIASGRVFMGAGFTGSGKMIAFGTPDFVIEPADVSVSETEPFLGEFITLEAKVKNKGSVAGSANVTFSYSSDNNTYFGDIGFIPVQLSARADTTVALQWQVPENPAIDEQSWKVLFNVTDVEPKEGNIDVHQIKTVVYHMRDLSQWQMFQGDLEHTGYAAGGSKSNRVIWKNTTNTPSPIRGSIVIADSKVYAATLGGNIQSFSEKTGQPLVEYSITGTMVGEPTLFLGEDTSSYDSIFVSTREGTIYSLELMSKTVQWSIDLGSDVYSTPMVYHGLVFVGAGDGYMYALDQDGFSDGDQGITDSPALQGDGDIVWKTDLGSAVGYSTSAISESQLNLYVGTTGGIFYAMDLYTGAVNWTYTTGGAIQSTPSIFGDVIVVGCNDSKLYAFDLNGFSDGDDGDIDSDTSSTNGDVIGIATLGGSAGRSSPAFDPSGEFVYIGTDSGKLHAISTVSGEVNWTYDAGASIDSSPAVGDHAVYFTISTGQLIALEKERDESTKQPKLLWNFTSDTNAGMLSSPAVFGNRVFVADEDGRVYALGAPNAPPKAVISSPVNDTQYFDYEEITFDGSKSSDLDDTTLYYIWSVRRETQSMETIIYSGNSPLFTTNFSIMKGGNYIIKLTVRDTLGSSDYAIVNITIYKKVDNQRLIEFCEPLIPACCLISVGGPGQVTMSSVSNPGKSSDVNLSVNKFVSFRYAEILDQDFRIEWTNITIGFKLIDLMYDMNVSRIRMYYWDDSWVKLPHSGVTVIDSENAEVWANFTGQISPDPVIFAPGTFDNTPPTVTIPIDGVLVEPTTGREIDDFTFKVLYRDSDSDSIHDGGWVRVFIDGNPFFMEEEKKGNSDYSTYVRFILTLTGKDIGLGPHTISFAAHDGTIRSLELLQTSIDLNISASSPKADSGADRTVAKGKSFNVDGSGSTDPDGDIVSYYWDFDSAVDRDSDGDYTNDRDKEGVEASWSYDTSGTYTITLTVVDSTGSEDTDTITVIVVPELVGGDDEGSDLGAALTAIGIGLVVIILALIIAFLFMYLKKKEEDELDRISAGELPLRKPTVVRVKRRRLGEEEDEEEDEDEDVSWEEGEDELPEGEELDELEEGAIPEERRLMPGDDDDELEIDEEEDEYEDDAEAEFEDEDEDIEDPDEDTDVEDEDLDEFDDDEEY